MGSKNNPGKFDCFTAAEPDEPMFVLLGRDPTASFLVADWAELREKLGKTSAEKIAEARVCARNMGIWAATHGKEEQLRDVVRARSNGDLAVTITSQKREIEALHALLAECADALESTLYRDKYAHDDPDGYAHDEAILVKVRAATWKVGPV
jgi:hypothetical protein